MAIKKSSIKAQIKAELSQGIGDVWFRFLIPVAIGMLYSGEFFSKIVRWGKYYNTVLQASFGDCLVYLFQGMKEYIPSPNTPFEVPIPFLLMNLVLAIFIGNYAVKDIRGFGKLKLVRCRRRGEWWFCKCLWNVVTVLLYYAALYTGVGLMCLFNCRMLDKGALFGTHQNILQRFLSTDTPQLLGNKELLIMTVVLPLLTAIAMSLFQMAMEFLVSPAISFVVIIAVYTFSAYYMSWFFPGNFMMVYRYAQVNSGGIHLGLSIFVDALIAVAAVIVGYWYFRKYDIYGEVK